MQFFQELGRLIDARWRERDRDERAFPAIASEALRELRPSDHVAAAEVASWAVSTDDLPAQVGDGSFGQPPITVYAGRRFFIEVLYWFDGSTSIHQHAFAGAFHVLDGASIHSWYRFRPERRVNALLSFGALELRECEYLAKGDIRPILPGRELIHSLFHLDRPSVSVVVRTYRDMESGPQYSYWKPSLSIASSLPVAEAFAGKLRAISLLGDLEHPARDALIGDAVESADLFEAILLLESLFKRGCQWTTLCSYVERVGVRHGDVWRALVEVFEEKRRVSKLMTRRSYTKSPEHRFFLALLLNIPSRKPMLDLVRRRFPEWDPLETILAWIREMSSPTDEPETNPLGIPLGEGELSILSALLHGCEGERLRARLCEEYEEDEVAALEPAIVELTRAFRDSDVFRPLFID